MLLYIHFIQASVKRFKSFESISQIIFENWTDLFYLSSSCWKCKTISVYQVTGENTQRKLFIVLFSLPTSNSSHSILSTSKSLHCCQILKRLLSVELSAVTSVSMDAVLLHLIHPQFSSEPAHQKSCSTSYACRLPSYSVTTTGV